MKDEPVFLQKNPHGVYYYRRPVVLPDQVFWLGSTGKPKAVWSCSLLTKDRRTAIGRMPDAADRYEVERHAQQSRNGCIRRVEAVQLTSREREEQNATAATIAASEASYEARSEYRTLARQRFRLSTAELTPQEAAWRDLAREPQQDLATLQEVVANQQATNDALAVHMGKAPALTGGHSIEGLIEAYEAAKSPGWSGSSRKAVVPVFRLLRDVFAGRSLARITRADARAVMTLLQGLPTQIGKRKELTGLSIEQAIATGAELGLPTIRPKTINDGYLLHIASMWNWAKKEEWVASNPFTGLSVHDPVDDADRRDPFTADQLATLFSQAPWDSPWSAGDDKPGAYWVPLLCLFQGLRNAEAAGLRVEDMGEDDNVPVLHVRGYDGRSLKNGDARGTLPLHSELVRSGFLAFVAERREAGETLLFPEGIANARGQVAAKLGERFSAHVKRLGFVGRKLGTHSFRHCFEDRLRAAELAERTALALARRREAGSSRVYGFGVSGRQKALAMEKIQYPGLDLSHLYPEVVAAAEPA